MALIKNINIMKKLFLILLALLPFCSKAQQLDTAWIGDDYLEQYIFPPLIDNSIERSCILEPSHFMGFNGQHCFSGIRSPQDCLQGAAQRYEVAENDSVCIMGVALYSYFHYLHNMMHQDDTITISILNSDLTETFYEKNFISGSASEFDSISSYLQTPEHNGFFLPFVECVFDDTITLYEDYYVAFEHNSVCSAFLDNVGVYCTDLAFMTLNVPDEEIIISPGTGSPEQRLDAPYRYGTKYKPYVKTCTYRNWIYVEDISWYEHYVYSAMYGDNYYIPKTDTTALKAFGICPIQAIIDTSSDSLDSGVVSVELLEENIEIYPNPAKDVLNINSAFAIKEVEIYDALNRLIEKRKANKSNIQLNIANYKAGSYIVNINTAKGSVKKKLIVE